MILFCLIDVTKAFIFNLFRVFICLLERQQSSLFLICLNYYYDYQAFDKITHITHYVCLRHQRAFERVSEKTPMSRFWRQEKRQLTLSIEQSINQSRELIDAFLVSKTLTSAFFRTLFKAKSFSFKAFDINSIELSTFIPWTYFEVTSDTVQNLKLKVA